MTFFITTLNPGKSKGINIVPWNFKTRQPKVAKGKTFSFSGFTTPRVHEGQYKAVIKKGKDTFEHLFDVVYDKVSGLTESERNLKNEVTKKLFNMTEELAYMVYEIDGIIEQIDNKKLANKLNDLKETLVITTGDNYVGTAELQLREKMANLYSKVAGSYDKPTASEMENLYIVENLFEEAKSNFAKLKKKVKAEDIQLKSFEEFINE